MLANSFISTFAESIQKLKMTNVTTLIPTKSDVELAAEFKERLIEVYTPLLKLLDEVDKAGFVCSIGTNKNAFGKQQIVQMIIAKHY